MSEDVKAVCNLIKFKSKYLRIIMLRDNLIRDDVGDELLSALKYNPNIIKLNLDINPLKY